MNTCTKCKEVRPDDQFYKNDSRCKPCMAAKYKAWVTSAAGRKKRNLINLKYTRSEKGRAVSRKAGKKYRAKPEKKILLKKIPIKHNARSQVLYALRTGKIKKEPCVTCGDINSQGHHEDYTKPLQVIWLCPKHHTAVHARKESHAPRKCTSSNPPLPQVSPT